MPLLASPSLQRLSIASILLISGTALAQSVTATLTANDTIYAQWSIPAIASGVIQTHPPGPLTSTSLSAPYTLGSGAIAASYSCQLTTQGDGIRLIASTYSTLVSGGITLADAHADLTLQVASVGTPAAAVSVMFSHFGDLGRSDGFRVDLGNDGSVDADSGTHPCSSGDRFRSWIWDFANGPLVVRIRTDQYASAFWGAQDYGLRVDVEPWHPSATPVATDCGAVAAQSTWRCMDTNYQMWASPPTQPGDWMVLKAAGFGTLDTFIVAGQSQQVPFQLAAPFSIACPLLSDPLVLMPGVTTALTSPFDPTPTPRQWELRVPPLPAGLVLHVQHASAMPAAPWWFGATNVLRIDT